MADDHEFYAQLLYQVGNHGNRFTDFKMGLHVQTGFAQMIQAYPQLVFHFLPFCRDFLFHAEHGNHRIFTDDDRLRRADDDQ
ncbi:hypothetical protein D3C81_2014430 [compost metagenome]